MQLMELRDTRTIILNQGTEEQKRAEIRAYFHKTFSIDEQLYETLVDENAFYLRAEPLRHPLIFYFGHTAAFYLNKLLIAKLISERINPGFEAMFAVGVDEMSWDDLNEANYNWPTLAELKNYRQQVRELVDRVIGELPLQLPIDWDSPFWVILMGIEHQRIHLETSSVIIRRLPLEKVRQLPLWDICQESAAAPDNQLLPVTGGKVILGKNRPPRLYGWDNEFGHHQFEVEDFQAARQLVSNQQFLAFVRGGGYQLQEFWTEEGWRWLSFAKAEQPLFWIKQGDNYRYRTMAQEIAMPWDWPVEVNYLEAKAFCNWQAAQTGLPIRLPTEDEWYCLRDQLALPDQPDWQRAPGNINLEYWASPCPVNRFSQGDFFDVVGNVWQWTETAISGFHGFEVHPCYDDFSTPTFDTRHNLIKGGCWISTGNEATRDSRYAFRRHFYQHAGFRYVAAEQPLQQPEAMYETDALVAQYCDAHFGPDKFGVGNFPQRLVQICLTALGDKPKQRALDLGCAVGRGSFELAKYFAVVSGVDFSARFIRIAYQLQEKGLLHYQLPEEGEIVSYHEKRLRDFGLQTTATKIEFSQGDAHNLKPLLCDYDLILAGNLLDRLYAPAHFLRNIHQRLKIGGLLVLASPYSWQEQYTKKSAWIGGIRKAGEPFTTLEGLHELLEAHFCQLGEPQEMEFVIRETARKFQHTISQLTIWERVR